ncbi:MAG: hypothetical protein ACR2FK_05070 [Sphingomicrobium sp.]
MNRFLIGVGLALAAASALAADVRVSITMGQPGYYGRVDIGGFPQPSVIYAEPVVVQSVPVGVVRPAVYMHVPPGHAKKWDKHCRKYNACGQPVYFVEERWYSDTYAPAYAQRHGKKSGKKQGKGRKDD